MNKHIAVILAILLFLPMLLSSGVSAEEEYAWVLSKIVDNDCTADIEQYNQDSRDSEGDYQYGGSYGRGNFTIEQTYVGKTDDYYDPDKLNGEKNAITAIWSEPPQMISSGEELSLTLSLSSKPATSYFDFGGYANAWIDNHNYLVNSEGSDTFKSVQSNDYKTWNEKLTVKPGNGAAEGSTMELTVKLVQGFTMSTTYVYEWRKLGDDPEITDETTETSVEPSETTSEEQTPTTTRSSYRDYVVPKTADGKYIDSGCRFSDLSGEVQIRHGDDRLGWDFAELDMIIYVGDVIRTKRDSSAIISLNDMTTFQMKAESEILMNTKSEEENKLIFLAGKVWTNFKKMVKDGTLDVEMSQAIAGAKGTTFVAEDDGETSILKVIEGKVEYTSLVTGESVMVGSGQMVKADSKGLGEIETFDVDKENKSWENITASKGLKSETLIAVIIIVGVLLLISIIILIVVIRRSRTK